MVFPFKTVGFATQRPNSPCLSATVAHEESLEDDLSYLGRVWGPFTENPVLKGLPLATKASSSSYLYGPFKLTETGVGLCRLCRRMCAYLCTRESIYVPAKLLSLPLGMVASTWLGNSSRANIWLAHHSVFCIHTFAHWMGYRERLWKLAAEEDTMTG